MPRSKSAKVACIVALYTTWIPAARAQEFSVGMQYYKAGQFARAAQLFEAAMRKRPDNSVALVNDAVCYHKLGDIERARALYMHVLAIFPDSQAAQIARDGLKILPPKGQAAPAPAPAPAPQPAAEASKATAKTSAATSSTSNAKQSAQAISDAVYAELRKASILHEAGKLSECQRAFVDALALAEKLGPSTLPLADVLKETAFYYADLREFETACRYHKREFPIRELLVGKRSRAMIDVEIRMAPNYYESGDLDTSEMYYRDVIPVFQREYQDAVRARKRLTGERDRYLNSLNGLSNVLKKRAIPHPAATHDEYDDLQVLIKQLQDEAKQLQRQ